MLCVRVPIYSASALITRSKLSIVEARIGHVPRVRTSLLPIIVTVKILNSQRREQSRVIMGVMGRSFSSRDALSASLAGG